MNNFENKHTVSFLVNREIKWYTGKPELTYQFEHVCAEELASMVC